MKRYLIIGILIAILAVGALILFGSTQIDKTAFGRLPPNLVWVAAVDYNHDGKIDHVSLLTGQDAMIVIDTTNLMRQPLGLIHLDANKDGIIMHDDPLFARLRILTFQNGGKTYIIQPIDMTAIRAIRLSHINESKEHEAVLVNSEHRMVKPLGPAPR